MYVDNAQHCPCSVYGTTTVRDEMRVPLEKLNLYPPDSVVTIIMARNRKYGKDLIPGKTRAAIVTARKNKTRKPVGEILMNVFHMNYNSLLLTVCSAMISQSASFRRHGQNKRIINVFIELYFYTIIMYLHFL